MPDNVPITAGVGTDIATDQLLSGGVPPIATAPSSHIVFWRCGIYMFRPGFATQIRRIPA